MDTIFFIGHLIYMYMDDLPEINGFSLFYWSIVSYSGCNHSFFNNKFCFCLQLYVILLFILMYHTRHPWLVGLVSSVPDEYTACIYKSQAFIFLKTYIVP